MAGSKPKSDPDLYVPHHGENHENTKMYLLLGRITFSNVNRSLLEGWHNLHY